MGRLEGKVAVITGGASGIGRACVHRFVEEGARVVVADIQGDAGGELERALNGAAKFVRTDVSKEDDVRSAIECAVQNFLYGDRKSVV